MNECSTKLFIGMDVSEEKIEIFILPTDGKGVNGSIGNNPADINKFLDKFDPSEITIAMETGTHSPWLNELMEAKGIKTYVANARKLRMIYTSDKKSDERDAEMLARIAKFDPKLLSPIEHRDKKSRINLSVIKSRDVLVRSRTTMMNSARGQLRSFGIKTTTLKPSSFTQSAYKILPPELKESLEGLLNQIRLLELEIKKYDKKIDKLCKTYTETQKLRQVKGVGPLVALTYVLTIYNPKRFKSGNRLASYIGLVPKRKQSGEMDKQLGITKTGDALLRKLMIQSANYILGPFGEECDLRDFGMKIMARGGNIAKKKAKVAVARKLSKLLLKLWTTDEKYDKQYKKLKNNKSKIAA
jgi:transposase